MRADARKWAELATGNEGRSTEVTRSRNRSSRGRTAYFEALCMFGKKKSIFENKTSQQ